MSLLLKKNKVVFTTPEKKNEWQVSSMQLLSGLSSLGLRSQMQNL